MQLLCRKQDVTCGCSFVFQRSGKLWYSSFRNGQTVVFNVLINDRQILLHDQVFLNYWTPLYTNTGHGWTPLAWSWGRSPVLHMYKSSDLATDERQLAHSTLIVRDYSVGTKQHFETFKTRVPCDLLLARNLKCTKTHLHESVILRFFLMSSSRSSRWTVTGERNSGEGERERREFGEG